MQFKPRVLNNKDNTIGITIPKEVAVFVKETYFSIERSGGDLVFKSGTCVRFNPAEIENYHFEDCRIKDGASSYTE